MRRGIALVAVLVGLCVAAPVANASFHLIKVREVAPRPAGTNSAFIELQMYAPGQTQLAGRDIRIYNGSGVQVTSFPLPANAGNGETQRSFLIGDDATPGGADLVNQQLSDALGPLGPGGAACFETVDCVAWGTFSPSGPLPSPPGSPAAPIPEGSSLTRSIAGGCATLLEESDDTDDSAADFAIATPTPRRNATPPTEAACGDGGGGDNAPPETTIRKGPKKKSEKTTAKFRFTSSESGSTFECKLDKKPFKACSSPQKYKHVKPGRHRFQVRASDQAGNTDATPAKYGFKVTR